ncbi:MAG: hypothetical protein J6D17_14095, partial [Bacteroides sp.]|nr:hypothetical protein [Bacteroides sp.]
DAGQGDPHHGGGGHCYLPRRRMFPQQGRGDAHGGPEGEVLRSQGRQPQRHGCLRNPSFTDSS